MGNHHMDLGVGTFLAFIPSAYFFSFNDPFYSHLLSIDTDILLYRFPDQRLTRLEALRGMTIDPAYASFSEDYLGSLEPGKRADWVVLSRDIMHQRMDPLESVKVLVTAIDGKVAYANESKVRGERGECAL